jgi:hypothetical protein
MTRMVECFGLYLDGGGSPINCAQAEQRMFANWLHRDS